MDAVVVDVDVDDDVDVVVDAAVAVAVVSSAIAIFFLGGAAFFAGCPISVRSQRGIPSRANYIINTNIVYNTDKHHMQYKHNRNNDTHDTQHMYRHIADTSQARNVKSHHIASHNIT